jgi:hypothetical protein
MKKLIITLSITVILIASAVVFYSCEKEEKDTNSEKNLQTETEFVAKIDREMCVNVQVFRDENGNVQIATQNTTNVPELAMGVIVPKTVKVTSLPTKDNSGTEIEIPNDAIYWLVPLDGNEPVKFEPNEEKAVGRNIIAIDCICKECQNLAEAGLQAKYDYQCTPVAHDTQGGIVITCDKTSTDLGCKTCTIKQIIIAKDNDTPKSDENLIYLIGSCYLVNSNSITINGITYE